MKTGLNIPFLGDRMENGGEELGIELRILIQGRGCNSGKVGCWPPMHEAMGSIPSAS